MRDIESRKDIEALMISFYEKALTDDLIGFFFTEAVPLQMDLHLPLIVDFWETILFNKAVYHGNVLEIHQHIHRLAAFRDEHFFRWLFLFKQTADAMFSGDKAELIKQRAESIATVMRIKLVHGGIGIK